MKRAPWIVWLGLAVVLAAAAVLSFDALRGLALAVSIPGHFAWLLPIAVDAGAAVSCSVWLAPSSPRDASRFAAKMTWSLLVATVAGNAGQLGMHAHGVTPPWPVAVAVGAIAPAVVGAVVHLVVLLVRDRDRRSDSPVSDQTVGDEAEPPASELDEWRDPWSRWGQAPETAPDTDADDQQGQPETPPDPLLPRVIEWARGQSAGGLSQRAVRQEFRVGGQRSKDLVEAAREAVR